MSLKHYFSKEPRSVDLFGEVGTLKEFNKRLLKLSKLLPKENKEVWGRNKNAIENENKIKGAGFELFCELFCFHFGYSPQIGIIDYEPINPSEDEGIDGRCKNLNEEPSAVQCKFVADRVFLFSTENSNISNFLNEATIQDIDWKNGAIKKLFFITTGKGLHYHTIEKLNDRVKVINGYIISLFVDNNLPFWNSCSRKLRE